MQNDCNWEYAWLYYCNGYSFTILKEEIVTIRETSASVKVDKTIQITVSSADANGQIKGIKEGTAVIITKGSEKIATCTITVKTDVNRYDIEYCVGSRYSNGKDIIKVNGLQGDTYYFLYVQADDETGKYIKQESVTLVQANVVGDKWFMFFYGFKQADFGEVSTDDTIAKEKLPHAGIHTIIAFTFGVIQNL